MRLLPLVLVLPACGTLTAHGLDAPEDCVDGDTDCVPTAVVEGDDDDDDGGGTTVDTDDGGGTPVPPPAEDCTNGADDDLDGDADCDDPECLSTCDADGDGDIAEALGGNDCDDTDVDVNLGATEICDGQDNDCVGGVDEDLDGDGVAVCSDCDETDPTVHPGATDSCDGFDSDCDLLDCTDWTDGFEGPVGPEWSTSGATAWNLHMASASAFEGGYSAQSGNIGNGQVSTIRVTVTFPAPGTISFWHTGSTEANYDYLEFYVGGALQQEWSGTWAWTNSSWAAPAGTFDLEWTYSKDGSLDGGSDTVWIDLVEITGGAP